MESNRRKGISSKLVEPYKQVKLGVIIIVINTIFAALFSLVIGYFLYDVYNSISYYFQLSNQQNIITVQKFYVPLAICFGLAFLFIVATLYISITYTHKIYGPLVSINRFMDTLLKNKKPEPINLRESDQLKELTIKLNEVADRMLHRSDISASTKALNLYVDSLLNNKTPPAINLPDNDPLKELSEKLIKLESSRSSE